MKKQRDRLALIIPLTLLTYCLSVLITKTDLGFSHRWFSFGLWIISISVLPLSIIHRESFDLLKKSFTKKEIIAVSIVFLTALTSGVLFLKNYPFVAMMDEVRDGGLNAQQILDGSIKNIHGYGRYESHGLIIPTLIVPFVALFKNSVFAYRLPAALISIADILLIYFLVRQVFNKRTAFFAALILANLPIHLYYGRTQATIAFSSLLTTMILFSFYLLIKTKRLEYYALLGLVLGFSSGFHASIRTVVIALGLGIFVFSLYHIIRNHKRGVVVLNLAAFLIFFLVGFGPRLLFTTPRIFFHTQRVPLLGQNTVLTALPNEVAEILNIYSDSLAVYISRPAHSFFHEPTPILPPLLVVLFVLGILHSLFLARNAFARYLILGAFLIPFTNSAITDCVNCDHRLAPVLPICAILCGLGVDFLLSATDRLLFFKKQIISTLLIISISGYILFRGYTFFAKELASTGKSPQDYLSMHTVYLLKSLPPQKEICLMLSPKNYDFFNLLHIKEQYEFFLPNTRIKKIADPNMLENEVYILTDCNSLERKFATHQFCFKKERFLCPLGYQEGFNVYVEEGLRSVASR